MLSKNNYKEKLKKMEPRSDHFSIRKLTVGTVSVLLGWTLISATNTTVKADTNDSNLENTSEVKPETQKNSSSQIKQNSLNVTQPTVKQSNASQGETSKNINQNDNIKKTSQQQTQTPIDSNIAAQTKFTPAQANVASVNKHSTSTTTSNLKASSTIIGAYAQTNDSNQQAVNLDDVNPNFNITSEAAQYNLGVTIQQGQEIYAQVYVKNLNRYITWATDSNAPGKNIYFYTTNGVTQSGQVSPNDTTTTLSATLNNSGNYLSGTVDTAAAGTIANSQYKGGQYNLSMSTKNGMYYQTQVTSANDTSVVNNGDSGSVSWRTASPIVWKFRSGFGDLAMPGDSAPTWQGGAADVPTNVKENIYYVNAKTGEVLGLKQSEATLAGNYYDVTDADPDEITVNGQNYKLVAANTVSDEVKNKQVATLNGTPILVSDLIDGQTNNKGQFSMYNKGDILMTLVSSSPSFKLFVKKILDDKGTAEYNTYDVDRSDVTPGTLKITLNTALSRPSVAKLETFSGDGVTEQNLTTTGNSGLVFFYEPIVETGSLTVTYHDDTTNTTIPDVGYQTGEEDVGTAVDYNPDSTIKSLEDKGYQLVPDQDINIPKEITKGAQNIVIHLVHGTQTVTPENPGTPGQPINPNDPNGPKWPDSAGKDALEMTGSQTVRYEGAGDKTPEPNTQNTTFTKSETIDKVTGDVISSTDWTPTEHIFGTVKTPVVEGYHADQAQAGGFVSTPTDPNKTIVVTYSPNGKIIPVDPEGNPIPDAPTPQFPTNPDNPTTTTDGKIPSVPGYTPESGQPGDPVKPGTNPGDDVKVSYVKNPEVVATTGKVTYYDETDKKVLSTQDLSGNVGDPIDYTTTDTITRYENQGYKFVNSTFNNDNETYQKDPADNDFIVNFVHGTQTVTPENPGTPGQPINPSDPDGPKWPDSAGKDALEMMGSQTVRYEGAGDKTPEPNTQNTTFTKSETIDKVTGDVISSTDWAPSEHTFGIVKTPVVEGYHADQAQAGGFTSTPADPDKTIVVTYAPNGKIIPVDPEGNPIPDAPTPQFPTSPDNPTTTTDGEIPSVPGYRPETGQPGDPVKPGNNPSDDVKVPYVKNPEVVATTGKVTYYDETDKKVLSTHDLEGNVGEKITYSTTDMITQYENQGYKFVNSTYTNDAETFQKDPSDNDFIVNFVHATQTVTPENPGTPGQPINPNDPNGPKWPDSAGKDALEMTGSQTIRYEGAGDKTPEPNTQNTTFTKSETIDKVTGDVISSTDWTPSEHAFGIVKTPVVDGYHADQAQAGGFTSTPADPNKTIVVTYEPNGKIIPVDPEGNPIPNVPNPPYTTNPDNPTSVNPNEPVPEIPGYTPEKSTVTPENPGTDTPVIYNKNEIPTPETGSVTVTYHDDTTNTTIPDVGYQTGEKDVGTAVDYNPDPTIKDLENKGYKLVPGQDLNIPKEITKGAKNIVIHLVHDTQTVTPENPGTPGQPINPNDPNGPKWPDSAGKDALEMTGSQTVRYESAGEQTPKPNEQSTTFTKSETIDKVTGDVISSTDWAPTEHTFGTVKTPIVAGYHADQAQAGGFTSTPADPNKTIVVTYEPNGKIIPVDPEGNPIPDAPTPQFPTNPDNPTTTTDGEIPSVPGYTPESGQPGDPVKPGNNPSDDVKVPYVKNPEVVATTGKVTYYDETDKKVLSTHDLEGNVGEKITYTTADMIAQYENQGYKLVNSNFKNGNQTYQKDPSDNDFIVNFVHGTQTVTPENPGTPGQPINPNDPNGPKWPDSAGKDALEMTGSQTVRYEGAGEQTPKPNEQSTTFTKSETIDKVTGDVISSTDWTPTEHTFGTVKTPIVAGYHANQAEAGGFVSTPADPNKTIVVTYSPNGKIIPVDPEGNPIPNVPNPPYITNPDNPTSVNPNEPVPEIPGYTPEKSTVTPENPGTDTKVIYTPNTPTPETGSLTVTYHDDTTNTTIPDVGYQTGEKDVGTAVEYNPDSTIKDLENKGYKLVPGQDTNIPKEITKGAKNIVIHLVHGTQTVTPENPGTPGQPINPNDPNGPKWPENTGKDALEMIGSQTIRYEGAGEQTPKPNEQSTTFTKSETIDKVTGKITSTTDWAPTEHTFGTIKTPVVEGYHADQAQAGGFTSTPADPNKTIVVTYEPNGKIIPVDPEGNSIPNVPNPPYTTNPNDPTSVNPNEPVPEIPGYTPEKSTVTPENPGTDTPVIYHKNETPTPETGSVTVTYHDDTTNTTIPDVGYQTGEKDIGTAINYNPDSTIKSLEDKGYQLVPGQDLNIPKEITNGAKNIVIHLVHGTQTVTPENPDTPGQPINPNDPNGPKWPDSAGKDALEKTGSQTIRYEGAGDKTPEPNTQNTTFTKTETIDKVTGDVISSTDWTPSEHTFGTIKTPVVEGYHADRAQAGGFTSTAADPNKTIVVTYEPNGKIIPVDPEGNPIPNVPNPPYITNLDNPTSVTPNEPVPEIPGYTPEKSTVTPENPGTDTPVIYHNNEIPTPETGSVTVTYHDDTTNTIIPDIGYQSGKKDVGTIIDYSPDSTIKDLENKGYKLVPGQDLNIPTKITNGAKSIVIHMVHDTVTVTPENPGTPGQPINPNDPNGPKWPENTGKDDLEKTGSQTVRYEGAGEQTPKDNVHTITFTKTITIDKVTGKEISTTAWTPATYTFGMVQTPIIEGYHANKAEVGGFTASPDDLTTVITVTYTPNKSVIPEPSHEVPSENNQKPAEKPTKATTISHSSKPVMVTSNTANKLTSNVLNTKTPVKNVISQPTAVKRTQISKVQNASRRNEARKQNQELPRTGNRDEGALSTILGGAAALIGLIGLAGIKEFKKRR